jgi:hypothetical protein
MAEEAAKAVEPNAELLEWPKKDKRRLFHAVYRVGDLERTIKWVRFCFCISFSIFLMFCNLCDFLHILLFIFVNLFVINFAFIMKFQFLFLFLFVLEFMWFLLIS